MRELLAIAAVLMLAGCTSDVVTDEYASLDEAREGRLFERGWLPDVLPPSSLSIRTSNNLDRNTSEGEFYFSPDHAPDFYRRVSRGLPSDGVPENLRPLVADSAEAGLEPWWYRERDHTWVFFCSETAGKCRYTMW